MTIQAIVKKYINYMRLERNFSPNTLEAYTRDVEKLILFCTRQKLSPLLLDRSHLEQFAIEMHRMVTPKSQARILSGTRAFYRYLLMEGYIDDDPTQFLEWPCLPDHLPQVLTVQEVDQMEAAIDLSQPEGQRNKAIIEVLFSCGLRVSELTQLQLSDLYLDERFLRVSKAKGNKQRLVPLSDAAIHELLLWFECRKHLDIKPGEQNYVFLNRRGAHLTRTMILIIVKCVAEAAGIRKTVSPHTFRHSFATCLVEGGADLRSVQVLLGHERVGTTEMYTHLSMNTLRQVIELHHPRNSIKC